MLLHSFIVVLNARLETDDLVLDICIAFYASLTCQISPDHHNFVLKVYNILFCISLL
jgi:hypothetical protein